MAMKTLIKVLAISVTALLLLNSSCGDRPDEVYTRIYPDGSCYREFETGADSAYFAGDRERNPFPFKPDSSWTIAVNMVTDTTFQDDGMHISNHYTATAFKEFPSVNDIKESLILDDEEGDSIVPEINFRKKFQWFYNYYEYHETYPSINQLPVPITGYFSEEEADTWFGENDNMYRGLNGIEINELLNNIEYNVNAWYNRNYYEIIFTLYSKYFRYFENMPVDSLTFASAKDTIFEHNKRYIESSELFEFDIDSLLNDHFQSDLVFDPNGEVEDTLENEFFAWFGGIFVQLNLNSGLSLPGKVIETNAPFTSGDTLSWNVDDRRFFIHDYSLTATSRKPNYWTFIATGLIIALSVIGFWVKRK